MRAMTLARAGDEAPPPHFAGIASGVSLVASGIFVILLASLHAVEPEIDPSWRFVREHVFGACGWTMLIAVISLGVSCLASVLAIRCDVQAVGGMIGARLRRFERES